MTLVFASLTIVALAGLIALARIEGPVGYGGPAASHPNALAVALSAFVTVAAFALWTGTIDAAAHAQRPLPPWFARLPLLVIDDRAPLFGHAPDGWIAGLASYLESAGLCGMFFALRNRRADVASRSIVAVAFVVMAAIALGSRSLASFDLYAYAGAVHAGTAHAYAPLPVPFSGDWAVLNRIYGTPIVPSPYGPLWILISYAVTAPAGSLAAALVALRVLELLALAGAIASLRALRTSPAVLAVFTLNPALFASFVADGHNDLLAVSFVLGAAAIRARVPALAIVLAACAGAIKLPFLIIAPLAFGSEPEFATRVRMSACAAAGGLALSFVFGGIGYATAVRETAGIYRATFANPTVDALRFGLIAIVAGAVVVVVATRRSVPTLAWAFAALGASIFSWYLAWGIPYAALDRRWFPAFLVSLPALTFALSTIFAVSSFSILNFYLVFALAPAIALLASRRERAQVRGAI